MRTMGTLIQADNVSKTYTLHHHRIEVLAAASLHVSRGECVSVVGRSGAGKSTLLHLLGGLDRPDAGSGAVLINGEDMYALSSARRTRIRSERIGFVFQSYHLLNEMDVLENVMLPARALGRSGRAIRSRARELLDAVGIADRARHTPLELSGGEQQRAAIARALMNTPELILADEPTGNLDDETGHQVLEYLFNIVRTGEHTLLMVTHNARVAGSCDRMLELANGQLRTHKA